MEPVFLLKGIAFFLSGLLAFSCSSRFRLTLSRSSDGQVRADCEQGNWWNRKTESFVLLKYSKAEVVSQYTGKGAHRFNIYLNSTEGGHKVLSYSFLNPAREASARLNAYIQQPGEAPLRVNGARKQGAVLVAGALWLLALLYFIRSFGG